MKDWDKLYICVCEQLVDRHRRRLFENRLALTEGHGYEPRGHPAFFLQNDGYIYGVQLMRKSKTRLVDSDEFFKNVKSKNAEKTKRRKCPS